MPLQTPKRPMATVRPIAARRRRGAASSPHDGRRGASATGAADASRARSASRTWAWAWARSVKAARGSMSATRAAAAKSAASNPAVLYSSAPATGLVVEATPMAISLRPMTVPRFAWNASTMMAKTARLEAAAPKPCSARAARRRRHALTGSPHERRGARPRSTVAAQVRHRPLRRSACRPKRPEAQLATGDARSMAVGKLDMSAAFTASAAGTSSPSRTAGMRGTARPMRLITAKETPHMSTMSVPWPRCAAPMAPVERRAADSVRAGP
mmetsp:Transcript_12676/g.42881  ORF Transcript_12676/g.42881 Transcript_12676/m.42881 type:complete len:270 (+) Transcript_12676:914-1723(+)